MSTPCLDLASRIAELAREENAQDVKILDVRELTIIAEYFVIASGRSTVQVKSIAEKIEDDMLNFGEKPARRDGFNEGRWVVLDYKGVLVHIFRQEERDFYQLDNLWGDARQVSLSS